MISSQRHAEIAELCSCPAMVQSLIDMSKSRRPSTREMEILAELQLCTRTAVNLINRSEYQDYLNEESRLSHLKKSLR